MQKLNLKLLLTLTVLVTYKMLVIGRIHLPIIMKKEVSSRPLRAYNFKRKAFFTQILVCSPAGVLRMHYLYQESAEAFRSRRRLVLFTRGEENRGHAEQTAR